MHNATPFDRSRLAAGLARFTGGNVLLVGDIMLDEYLEGDAERISPEAPIPIVKVSSSRLLLGGAGNVARNIVALGGRAHIVGVCGCDAKGDVVRGLLAEAGISGGLTSLAGRPTTLKTRVIARNQQMLRIDHEEIEPLPNEATAGLLQAIAQVIDTVTVVVVSDYGKGVVTRELMCGLRALREASPSRPRILVDPKTPNFSLYTDVHLLTPNAKETSEGANLPARTPLEILAAGRAIFAKLHCEHLLTTLGANGMALFFSPDEAWHIPTTAQKVFDVTGAGDTVMATLALGLAAGVGLLDACILANYAAGMVVADVGASVVSNAALRERLLAAPELLVSKWLS